MKKALAGKSPDERANEVIAGTKLDDVAVRKQLYEGGKAAVDASTDPLIVMMRTVEPDAFALHQRNDDEVDSVLRKNAGDIAKLHFAEGGLSVPPDATFTLRLSYGAMKGYELNGKHVPWSTTHGRSLRARCGPRQQAALRIAGELDQGQILARSEDGLRHGLHPGHHRRQLRQPGDQQRR